LILWRSASIQDFTVPRWLRKCCIHLKVWMSAILEWLNLRDWKFWRRGHLQWHDLPTEFHKHEPNGSKIDKGRHTDSQTERWSKSLCFPFRKESRLKWINKLFIECSYISVKLVKIFCFYILLKSKAVPLHAMEALGGGGGGFCVSVIIFLSY
jgi:hypothetical protein